MTEVSLTLKQHGYQRALDLLSPGRMRRTLDGALGLAARHMLKVIRADSRVDTGYYKGRWWQDRVAYDERRISNDAPYAEYVTGASMSTTLPGGRRRGAGDAFMRKIKRQQASAIKAIIEERVFREFR